MQWRDDTTPRAYGHFDEAWVKPASSRVKIHAVVDSSGLPVRLALTTGEAHDNRLAAALLSRLRSGSMLLATVDTTLTGSEPLSNQGRLMDGCEQQQRSVA